MHCLEPIVRFWPFFAVGFNLLACLLASVHVLLHKRDSRAATLWIGFIWLLPLLGPVLYLALGVNRIRRRAVSLGVHGTFRRPAPDDLGEPEHAGAEHLQQLALVVSRVVAQPLAAGNRIEPLVNGDEAFPAMLGAIESAKTSVSLGTYIFDNDASGAKFVVALEGAVRRGVPVRATRGRRSHAGCGRQEFPAPGFCPLRCSRRGARRPSICATTASRSLWTDRSRSPAA